MSNTKKTFLLTLKNHDGSPFAKLAIDLEEVMAVPASSPTPPPPNPASTPKPGSDRAERMTEPQKRYLFRLLAAQGINGNQAEAHLTGYFKVTSLRDITKAGASEYINQLVADRRDTHGA